MTDRLAATLRATLLAGSDLAVAFGNVRTSSSSHGSQAGLSQGGRPALASLVADLIAAWPPLPDAGKASMRAMVAGLVAK